MTDIVKYIIARWAYSVGQPNRDVPITDQTVPLLRIVVGYHFDKRE